MAFLFNEKDNVQVVSARLYNLALTRMSNEPTNMTAELRAKKLRSASDGHWMTLTIDEGIC